MTATAPRFRRWGVPLLGEPGAIRQLGTITVSVVVVERELVHARALGAAVATVTSPLTPASLTRTRALGRPALAWGVKVTVAALDHPRTLGDVQVRSRSTLVVPALSRAG